MTEQTWFVANDIPVPLPTVGAAFGGGCHGFGGGWRGGSKGVLEKAAETVSPAFREKAVAASGQRSLTGTATANVHSLGLFFLGRERETKGNTETEEGEGAIGGNRLAQAASVALQKRKRHLHYVMTTTSGHNCHQCRVRVLIMHIFLTGFKSIVKSCQSRN